MAKFPPMLLEGLGPKRVAAVKAKVRKLGTTPGDYFKQLIDEDLELDHLVATRSISELSASTKMAFENVSGNEIGRIVEASRERHLRRPGASTSVDPNVQRRCGGDHGWADY